MSEGRKAKEDLGTVRQRGSISPVSIDRRPRPRLNQANGNAREKAECASLPLGVYI